MIVLYLEALAAIALSLSILMAIAWTVQQRAGNSGWVDTIRTFSLGVVGAGNALWPIAGAAHRTDGNGCSRRCARAASAIATISRAPACSFRCPRKREW